MCERDRERGGDKEREGGDKERDGGRERDSFHLVESRCRRAEDETVKMSV